MTIDLPVTSVEMLEFIKRQHSHFTQQNLTNEQAISFCVLFAAYSMLHDLTNPVDCFKKAMVASMNLDQFEDDVARQNNPPDTTEE